MPHLFNQLDEYTLQKIWRYVFDDCLRILNTMCHSEYYTMWIEDGLHHHERFPALLLNDGSPQYWCCTCLLHGGSRSWWTHGNLDRSGDQPAVIEASGTKIWYRKGRIHRENDQPAVIISISEPDPSNIICCNIKGRYPAGTQIWVYNGYIHREHNRPAIIYPNGDKEWYYQGKQVPPPSTVQIDTKGEPRFPSLNE